MRLRTVLLAIFGSLAFAAPAAADGPVLFFAPTTAGTIAPSPLMASTQSVQDELSADRRGRARGLAAERPANGGGARHVAPSASGALLSDRLDAERSAALLQVAADSAAARVGQLRQEIETLESELQPIAPSPFDPFAMPTGASTAGAEAVTIAEQYLGVPYRWGGADPNSGFDCSGLMMYVYGQLGVRLPHYAAGQWSDLAHIDASQLQPGDLVFFEPRWNGPGHVGMYVGGDSFIEAPHTGDVVKIATLSQAEAALGFVGAARPAVATVNPFA
jgi:cell wall-associated NlpC family hydrolase